MTTTETTNPAVSAGILLQRLLGEIKRDNERGDYGTGDCYWCGKTPSNHYDDVLGFTWHDGDCAYLAAHMWAHGTRTEAEAGQ